MPIILIKSLSGEFVFKLGKHLRILPSMKIEARRVKRLAASAESEETVSLKRVKCETISKKAIKEEKRQSNKAKIIDNLQNSEKCDILSNVIPDGTLNIESEELDLERTLMGGQSFRWTKKENALGDSLFTGIVSKHVFQLWRPSKSEIAFRTLNKESKEIKLLTKKSILEDYFHIKYNLGQLYEEWSSKDSYLASRCREYKGFRILRQDPVENVFCFICATNNNIKRISLMVDKLCQRFGTILEPNDSSQSIYDSYYTFPTVERLAEDDVFQCLRFELGFGYRAKYISETAKKLLKISLDAGMTPREYLLSLRELSYQETRQRLTEFHGIGRKVADCICLMSMDHLNSVPTDCHIYEIFRRNYMPCYAKTNLTETMHQKISDFFNELHGPLAGWSTSVLFIAELKHLKTIDNEKTTTAKTKKIPRKKK